MKGVWLLRAYLCLVVLTAIGLVWFRGYDKKRWMEDRPGRTAIDYDNPRMAGEVQR